MKFENKISIDGVAIIVTAISAAIWIGRLQMTVEELKSNDVTQQQAIKELTVSQNETTKQLAVVATIVNTINQRNKP